MMENYDEQARKFLEESNTKMTIEPVDVVMGFPFDTHRSIKTPHVKYAVTLARDGKSYTFDFYGSTAEYESGEDSTPYDILACVEKYDVGDMGNFVEEFGYEIKDRESFVRVEKIWQACKDQYKNLLDLFGEEWMEKLCEIN